MQQYRNLGGGSGVAGYEIGADRIIVEFNDGSQYVYTYASAGKQNIEIMKQLAAQGRGLHSFINKNVKKDYAQKLR